MEINQLLLEKGQFIGLYYGQCVAKIINSTGEWIVGMSLDYSETQLVLKKLENLTEEDAAKIPKRNFDNVISGFWCASDFINFYKFVDCFTSEEADLLRSMGYAMEWRGISDDEQLKRKWIILKTKEDAK